MPASYVAERQKGAGAVANPFTLSPATNCTAGNTLIIVVINHSGNAGIVSGITDTPGNAWSVDKTGLAGANRGVSICSTRQLVAALVTTDTISVTMSVAPSVAPQFWLEEFSGAYIFDVGQANSGTTGAGNTGTTATTTAADEFAIAGFCATKSAPAAAWTWTKDTNYTNFTTAPPLPTGNSTLSSAAHYRILSATGTQICTDTVSVTSNTWAGVIATYKASAVTTLLAQPCNFASSGVMMRRLAHTWRNRRRSGILVPDLWLPNRPGLLLPA